MEKIYSKINKDKLLHAIHRFDDFDGRQNISPDEQFLQLATIQNEKGVKYKPHMHIWKDGEDKIIAQESRVSQFPCPSSHRCKPKKIEE